MTEQAPLPGQPEGPESAGALLRQMRQAAGMDVGVLAGALKVPVHKIEALETDRLEQFPNLTFARGLAGAICRALRTDAAPVLARMPVGVTELHEQAAPIDQPFRRSGEGPAPIASRSSRPWVILTALVLLGIVLLALWPTLPVQLGAPSQPDAEEERQEHVDALPPPPAPSVEQESAPAPAVPAAPAASQAQAQEAPASAPAVATAAAAPVAAPAASAASAAAGPAGAGVLGLIAKSEAWVSVRDAKDKVLVNRTLAAGDSLNVDGELPLAVTIGRKDAVAVTVRGKPLEVKTSGTSTVMRFTVE